MQTHDLAFSVTQELKALVELLAERYKITPETLIHIFVYARILFS